MHLAHETLALNPKMYRWTHALPTQQKTTALVLPLTAHSGEDSLMASLLCLHTLNQYTDGVPQIAPP